MDFFVPIALSNPLTVDLVSCRKMAERSDQALELEKVRILFVESRRRSVRAVLQDTRVFPGVHRKAVIVVGHIKLAAFLMKHYLQFATLQHHAVMIGEYRN